jgi:hypothetical protein
MGVFVLLSVVLRQKGSAESKKVDEEEEVDREGCDSTGNPRERRFNSSPAIRWLYKNSLSIAFLFLFLASFVLHGLMSGVEAQEEAMEHGRKAEPILHFFMTPDMWFQSFQNWQSEFLAIASIVVLTIFLRQKGSPQSKPVDSPDDETSK